MGDSIQSVMGIMNGTTNFMLTKMETEGADYAVVLKEAQDLGYAEGERVPCCCALRTWPMLVAMLLSLLPLLLLSPLLAVLLPTFGATVQCECRLRFSAGAVAVSRQQLKLPIDPCPKWLGFIRVAHPPPLPSNRNPFSRSDRGRGGARRAGEDRPPGQASVRTGRGPGQGAVRRHLQPEQR